MYNTFSNSACAYFLVQIAGSFKVCDSENLLDFVFPILPSALNVGSVFHYNQVAEQNPVHILAYSCALHCVGWVWFH